MFNRVETTIAAPPARVWSFIRDFSTYPAWNPLTPRVDGPCEAGARVEVWVKLRGAPFLMPRRILDVQPERRFEWTGIAWYSWMFPGERVLLLEPTPDGGTHLVDEERADGLGFLIQGSLRAMLIGQLHAFGRNLKAVAEGGAPVEPVAQVPG